MSPQHQEPDFGTNLFFERDISLTTAAILLSEISVSGTPNSKISQHELSLADRTNDCPNKLST
jgi:hypothetical protein